MPTLNPWVLLGELVTIGLLCAACYLWGHHNEALVFDAYKATQSAKAETQVADNKGALLRQAQEQAAGLQSIASTRQEKLDEITTQRDKLLADNGAMSQRLRNFLGASATAALVSRSTSGTDGPDAAAYAALSERLEQLAQFNTRQFAAADADLVDLNAAQGVIEQDRRVCTGELPGVQTKKSADAVPPTSAQPPALAAAQ
jgi:hypothetical protein